MSFNKTEILDGFNDMFFDFLDDIINIFKEDKDLKIGKSTLKGFVLASKSSIIKVWYSQVYLEYKENIDKGDIDYFLNKDYNSDLVNVDNSDYFIGYINKIREPIRNMTIEDKNVCVEYIKSLSLLSNEYMKIAKVI